MSHEEGCRLHGKPGAHDYDPGTINGCTCKQASENSTDTPRNMPSDTALTKHDCVWIMGECVPDCASCKRLDELLAERSAGYREGLKDMRKACIAAVLAYADERLVITENPNASMDITAALRVAADRLREVQP